MTTTIAAGGSKRVAADHLDIDRDQLRRLFDKEPFLIKHRLCDHPLLQLPRLIELAQALPEKSVEYNAGNVNINQDPDKTPRTGLSIEETLHQIESRQSWMVLKYVEDDPAYRKLLDECLDQVDALLAIPNLQMSHRHAFIFVSSPDAVTPYHVDFEHNFLLQMRGLKYMTAWNGEDRVVMDELARERMYTGGHRNLYYDESFAARGQTFELRPGDGLHMPLASPHWVKVGGEVSVSLSITFSSSRGDRIRGVHRANAFLRRHGIVPSQAGIDGFGNSIKFNVTNTVERVQRIWSRLRPGADST
jgi:hypothetical protein